MPRMMRPRVAIKDDAERQRRLEYVAKQSRNSYAKVGIIGADDFYPGTEVTIGQVAAWNEFGTRSASGKVHTPARPFFRLPIDSGMTGLNKVRVRAIDDVLHEQISIAEALERLGVHVTNRIKSWIQDKTYAPLKAVTIEMKQTDRPNKGISPTPDTPLMDSGLMLSRIGYEVYLESGGD